MTDPAPITQDGASVVISGAALPLMYRALLALIARRHRDGLAASPLLQQARTTLFRACMSPARQEDAPASLPGSGCAGQDGGDRISVAEAAALLGVSKRTAQRLAGNGLDAIRCGSIWVLRRSSVLALADERKARQ